MVQVWNEGSSEDEVLAMVVRTGLCTTMGIMLRQVTNPLHRPKLYKDPFLIVSPVPAYVALSCTRNPFPIVSPVSACITLCCTRAPS